MIIISTRLCIKLGTKNIPMMIFDHLFLKIIIGQSDGNYYKYCENFVKKRHHVIKQSLFIHMEQI